MSVFRVELDLRWMSHNLTMSMMVDNRSELNHCVTLRPRAPSAWIPDERVQRCFGCSALFSFLRRKHHCRLCGRVFCDACTAYREKVPVWHHKKMEFRDAPQRMCASCAHESRTSSAGVDWLIKALSVMPLTFPELFVVRLINKKWNQAVNTILSLYRGLQYKLPGVEYSTIETDFLLAHYSEFGHHIPWQVHTFCAVSNKDKLSRFHAHIDMHHQLSCRTLLCSKVCSSILSIDNILRLGMTTGLCQPFIVQTIVDSWTTIHY